VCLGRGEPGAGPSQPLLPRRRALRPAPRREDTEGFEVFSKPRKCRHAEAESGQRGRAPRPRPLRSPRQGAGDASAESKTLPTARPRETGTHGAASCAQASAPRPAPARAQPSPAPAGGGEGASQARLGRRILSHRSIPGCHRARGPRPVGASLGVPWPEDPVPLEHP